MMVKYGDMAVAGLGVAMKVNMIVVMLLIGLGTGIQPLLGFCFGAGNRKRYVAVLKFSLGLAFGLSVVMTVVCYCGAGPLVTAFLDNADAYEYGMAFARIYIYSGPIMGILFVFSRVFDSARMQALAQPVTDYLAALLAAALFLITYRKYFGKEK